MFLKRHLEHQSVLIEVYNLNLVAGSHCQKLTSVGEPDILDVSKLILLIDIYLSQTQIAQYNLIGEAHGDMQTTGVDLDRFGSLAESLAHQRQINGQLPDYY